MVVTLLSWGLRTRTSPAHNRNANGPNGASRAFTLGPQPAQMPHTSQVLLLPPTTPAMAELDELLDQLEADRQEEAMRKLHGSCTQVTRSAYFLISQCMELT